MSRYTHKAGKHTRTPIRIALPAWNRKDAAFEASFPSVAESGYLLEPAAEQADWNKLCGIDYSPLTPGNWSKAVFVAWRYMPDTARFEVGLYAHNERGTRIVPEQSGLLEVEPGHQITGRVGWREGRWFLDLDVWSDSNGFMLKRGHLSASAVGPERLPRWSRKVFPWFGGTLPAPTDVSLLLEF